MNYPNNKCGSCEGCWFKKNNLMPDNENVRNGHCPAYHEFEFGLGRLIKWKHWSDDKIIESFITVVSPKSIVDTMGHHISRINVCEYMNRAYDDSIQKENKKPDLCKECGGAVFGTGVVENCGYPICECGKS